MKKKSILCAVVVAMILSIPAIAFAASGYTMTYKPGTTDAVTNLPAADTGTGGEAYNVSSQIPERQGYEFIDWTLDYDVATYKVTYVVNPDPTYGTPEGSKVPTDQKQYAPGETVDVEDQLTTTVDYAYNEKNEKVEGTWEFVTWDKDDFEIYEDTTITGSWVFEKMDTVKTYKVTYVVNPDPTYGTPEGSKVPTDHRNYRSGEEVKVNDQLTTTVDYAYNEKGEKVKGTWEFVTWDKADFQIYEDTTITGGWVFTAAPAKTYSYTVHYKLYEGSIANAQTVNSDTYGTVDALGDNAEVYAIAVKDLNVKKYKNPKKIKIRSGFEHVTVAITHDNYEITIWYEPVNTGR